MAGMLVTTFPYNTATTGSAGEQRDVLAVTRVAAMTESERQALNQVALSAVPELVSAAVGTLGRVDEGLSGSAKNLTWDSLIVKVRNPNFFLRKLR